MIVEKNHQLKPGTILDGRYEVGSVLGEGGFGITYEGINRNTGKRVAIKEFFCREYMGRASDGTGRTVLTADHGEKRFKTERRRFLREARIVRDYKDEPSIVSVVDYFEDNDTAYIVMEFIEGETLRSYVSNKGKFDPAALFDEIRPLMRSLLKLHNAGIIHRDISPENIIRNSDGQMVLIDFGSARDLSSNTQTTALVFKDGYAPPEQYTSGKGSSPAIDIYGLCATLYYCLSGTVPLSSTQRIMYDELKPVSENAAVPESINDMISRGMALKAEERYKNIGEMLSIIDEAYPYLSPEEKARLRRKKITHILAVAAIVLTMAGLLIKLVMENYTDILMKTEKPVSIHFMWENETQAKHMEPFIKRKIAAFSGDKKYETYVKGREVIARIPAGQFSDQKPVDIARCYFAPECSGIILYTCEGQWGDIKTIDNGQQSVPEKYTHFYSDEIDRLSIEKGVIPIGETSTAEIRYIEIVLNDKAAERTAGMLSEPGAIMRAEIGTGNNTLYGHVFSAGDGRTMYLVIPDAAQEEQYYRMIGCSTEGGEHQKLKVQEKKGGDIYKALLESLSETQKGYIMPARCYCESVIEWKSVLPGFGRGEYQCSPSEISGDYTIIEVRVAVRNLDTDEGRKAVRVIKARLDGLQIPYAIGEDYYDRNRIAIKIGSKQMYMSEAAILGSNDLATVTNGFASCPISAGSFLNQDEDIEGIQVIVRDKTERKKIIKQNEEHGLKHVYLKYGGINIARIDTESFKRQLDKAEVNFEDLCTYTINDDKERKKKHIRYVLAAINTSSYELNGIGNIEIFNKEDELLEQGGFYSFDNSCFSELDKYLDEVEKKAEYSAYDMTYGFSYNEVQLSVIADDLDTEDFEQQAAERIKAFIEDNDLYNNDYQLTQVIFRFTNSENRAEDDCYAEAKITLEAEIADKAAGSANTANKTEVQYKISQMAITVSNPREMYDIEKTTEFKRKLGAEMDRANFEWVEIEAD